MLRGASLLPAPLAARLCIVARGEGCMTTEEPRPFVPAPKTAIDAPPDPASRPQTVGYLIGAIVQLLLGGFCAYRGLTGSGGTVTGAIGVALLFIGARAVVRYRRSRGTPPIQG